MIRRPVNPPTFARIARRAGVCAFFAMMPPAWAHAQTVPADESIVISATRALDITGVVGTAIRGNSITETDVDRLTLLQDSFVGHRGIGQLNQDVGTASNQANLLLIAWTEGTGNGFQWTELVGTQETTGNSLVVQGGSRSNEIANSFGDGRGLVQVNQNAGALNQQRNIAGVNIGSFVGTFAASLTEANLAGVAAGNSYTADAGVPRRDVIDGSFAGFRGVAQVTQSSGDGNAITNATVIGVTVLNLR
jgi:hypothetical protein